MQGPGVTIMNAAEKLNAFLLKLSLEKCRLEVGNYASFPLLENLILKNKTRKESDIFISMRKEFCSHLDTLQTFFKGYFNLGSLKDEAWIQNPFLIDLNSIDDEDPNNTLVLSRTEGVRSHLNSLTPRFPKFPFEELVLPLHARCVLSRLCCNGHSLLLGSYLSRFGRTENPSCSACGRSSQDTSHRILHYPATDSLRRSLFGDSLSLYDLWSRPRGVAPPLGLHGLPPCPHPSEGVG